MSYQLGIDLGTTFTAAAVYRDGRAEIVELGTRAAAFPSVVFVREDEAILTGEAAARRGATEPGRVAREFKRRLGDPTPIIVGGAPYSAEALMSKTLRSVVDAVAEREGGPAERVTVSHPANWGPYKRELLEQAIRLAGLTEAEMITEPEAAAIYYASNERVEPGTVIAVYDLGGGTFDAAVLRKTAAGFEILGRPEGIEHLGGIDFDRAVMAHVNQSTAGALDQLDTSDPGGAKAAARLREEIVDAKEALSHDTEASIPVVLPSVQTDVRLTRGEFEAMVRPSISETIAALRRALESADVLPADVSKVLLVGGSSRIPMIAQMVSAELGRPVAVDAHPKHAIALGAALAAAGKAAEPEAATIEAPPEEQKTTEFIAPAAVPPTEQLPPDVTPPAEREAPPVSKPPSKVPRVLMALVVLVALAAGLAWFMGWPPFTKEPERASQQGPQQGGQVNTGGNGGSNTGGGATTHPLTVTVQTVDTTAATPSPGGTSPSGTVTSDPAGISCESDCDESYPAGTTVTLTATPSSGMFVGWGGACSGTDPTCTVTMNGPVHVEAGFA